MIPYCETPGQSVAAAVAAGLGGGVVGVLAGFDPLVVALLAGVGGGLGDLAAHAVRRDPQSLAALEQGREWLGRDG